MAARDELLKRIEKKKAEIAHLEAQVRDGNIYIQALEEALKLLPKDRDADTATEIILRPGSGVAKARGALKAAGKPLQIADLLRAMGKECSRESRAALSGSLSAYVRKGEIFTRPYPNTFGLIEFESNQSPGARRQTGPPLDFGLNEQERERG